MFWRPTKNIQIKKFSQPLPLDVMPPQQSFCAEFRRSMLTFVVLVVLASTFLYFSLYYPVLTSNFLYLNLLSCTFLYLPLYFVVFFCTFLYFPVLSCTFLYFPVLSCTYFPVLSVPSILLSPQLSCTFPSTVFSSTFLHFSPHYPVPASTFLYAKRFDRHSGVSPA